MKLQKIQSLKASVLQAVINKFFQVFSCILIGCMRVEKTPGLGGNYKIFLLNIFFVSGVNRA